MKRLLVSLAILALCSTAFAAGAKAPAENKALSKSDPVLIRLGLTDDQGKKIDALADEYKAKKAELKGKDKGEKGKELDAELAKKIREALTADQQPKFDAGQAQLADFNAKLKDAQTEKSKALKEAGADKDKKEAAGKAFDEKVKGLQADLDKVLDEKVGKVGGAAPAAK